VFVTSQVGSAALAGGEAHPRLPVTTARWPEHERPIGGARAKPDAVAGGPRGKVWLVVEAFGGRRPTALGVSNRSHRLLPELHEKHNLATPTPLTTASAVYAWFGNGQCWRSTWTAASSGRAISARNTTIQARWGARSSPTLHGDLLFLLC
jgi:hypothetical protein